MNQERFEQAVRAAKEIEVLTQFPARVTLAQWALESGWGQHSPGNNCFGITAYGGCQDTQLLDTTEWFTEEELNYFLAHGEGHEAILVLPVDERQGRDGRSRRRYACRRRFAKFADVKDCFQYRINLLTRSRRYLPAWREYLAVNYDVRALIKGIAEAGYATDPQYAEKLTELAFGDRINEALSGPASKVA